jgi:hypothetical protein
MPKMCKLTLPGPKGESAFVNPTTVLYVKATTPGNARLYFDNDRTLAVAVPLETVVRLLDVAMNADHV